MARRRAEAWSMSFLDVMSCGLGAVVLLYTIISAQSGLARIKETEDLNAEATRLERQVLEGYKQLAELRNALASTDQERVRAEGLAREVLQRLTETREELSKFEFDTLARRESLERLKADLKSLEEDTRRLRESAEETQTGTRVRSVSGDGDRQYLTGLKVGGQRVLVLVDASASMLDETVVNILRMRNMSNDRKLRSAKWQQAIGTVDWVSAQLPPEAKFQLYAFNTRPWSLVPGSNGRWAEAKDAAAMGRAQKAQRETPPEGGSSLINAFAIIRQLEPAPDNVILVTDGLPTQDDKPPTFKKLVDSGDREEFMQRAVRSLGARPPPINVVLLPMEGDPQAPTWFWRLAQASGGAFLSPPEDWP
ncbi:MAG: VWA domain-containing protein [Steroidobacteraceae bacterium]